MAERSRILFVDDEALVLAALRRMLHSRRHKWDMFFAQSSQEALDMLAVEAFDIIVSDVRMPGMDGARLLSEVRDRYPHMLRIALTGHASEEALVRTVGVAHQCLSKPCEASFLKSTLSRGCSLRGLLASDELRELVGGVESLPTLRGVFGELMSELQAAEPSIVRVGQLISEDIGMTTRILQLVNSPFFGLRRRIASTTTAVIMLGLRTVRALVLATSAFSAFGRGLPQGLSLERVRDHSLAVASLARSIAVAEEMGPRLSDESLIAGLLHDVGKLVLASRQPKGYRLVLALTEAEGMPISEAEDQVFGATHGQVGAYLLGLWGFSDLVIEAVALHHLPAMSVIREIGPLAVGHVANALELGADPSNDVGLVAGLDMAYLAELGLADRLWAWQKLRQQLAGRGGSSD